MTRSTCTSAATGHWTEILTELGKIDPGLLDGKGRPCPICKEGTDRFTFDDKDGRGTWICRQCPARPGKDAGAGDGMALLQAVTGWDFQRAAGEIERFLGLPSAALSNGARPSPYAAAPLAREPASALPAIPQEEVQLLRLPAVATDAVHINPEGPTVCLKEKGRGEKNVEVEYIKEAAYRYTASQGVWRLRPVGGGEKKFRVLHRKGKKWIPVAGPDPWPVWREVEAVAAAEARPGRWLLEAEGEKSAEIPREGGLACISQPGHAHSLEQIKPRYKALQAAGIAGIVYVADMDRPGLKRAQTALDAAAAVGLSLVVLPASEVWPSLPEGGSIDDGDGTPAERIAALETALATIGPQEWRTIWSDWRERIQPREVEQAAAATGVGEPAAAAKERQMNQTKTFIEEAAALRQALDEGLKDIDAMPDVAMRSVSLVQLRRNLGLQEKDFLALVHQLAEHQEQAPPEDFDALLAYADSLSTEAIIEDLLAVGLTLLAGEGGAGKSSLAYQLVEAVTTGGKFADQFQAIKAPCLIVQLDESAKDAAVKWRAMGFAPDKDLIHFIWKFNPMMIPELRAKVRDTGAKVVILDSLLKVAGGTISPKDAEFGLLIYRLNQLAAELGIAIVCIHHLVKPDRSKKRVEVTKDDIYGSAYFFNGAADACAYWGFREEGNPDPLFALKVLKNRSSLVEVNTTYEFEGSSEDQRISFRGMAGRTITLDEIKTHRERVRAFLLGRPGTVFTVKQVSDFTGIGSPAYAKKLLAELFRARVGVDRKQLPSTGGRPPYGYYGSEDSSGLARIICTFSKESLLPSLSLGSLPVEGGSKGVHKVQKSTDFLSLKPRGITREEPDHGFSPALDRWLEDRVKGEEAA